MSAYKYQLTVRNLIRIIYESYHSDDIFSYLRLNFFENKNC